MYTPKSHNVIQEILQEHFSHFEEIYENKYADEYGSEHIIRIKEVVERFLDCGDYSKGIARIQCTDESCSHELFRPFSCKSFYFCPSCHQKRLLIFAEQLCEDVLLKLPHRQFVFTMPNNSWQLAVGSWQLAVGSWQGGRESWQLAVGSWQGGK